MKKNVIAIPKLPIDYEMPTGGLVLNLGCGYNQYKDAVNIDLFAECEPDFVCDLETERWPLEDDSVDYVIARHIMEHLGETKAKIKHVWQELYRVMKDGAAINMAVPHPLSDDFIGDYTHCTAYTNMSLSLFDLEANKSWIEGGYANSPLAVYWGIDFAMLFAETSPSQTFLQKWKGAPEEQLAKLIGEKMHHEFNICSESRFILKARKA